MLHHYEEYVRSVFCGLPYTDALHSYKLSCILRDDITRARVMTLSVTPTDAL